MYILIYELLRTIGLIRFLEIISNLLTILILSILCLFIRYMAISLLSKLFANVVRQTNLNWYEILIKNKTYERLANLVIPILISCYGNNQPFIHGVIMRTTGVTGVVVSFLLLDSILHSVDEIYRLYELSKTKPIRGMLQVCRVVLFIFTAIIGIAIFLGKSPMVFIGGVGAMTAVTSFIFKDAIIGFVAGIQLTANDMVRIGDWIELPKYMADGTVTDLTMTTVMIENFDKTITSLPSYILVSEAFINWRGMEKCGGRRMKRSIYLDPKDVKPCDEEMMQRLKKISLLKGYLEEKEKIIEAHNKEYGFDGNDSLNGRQITNIGTFRAYIMEFLQKHPGIRKDMALIVRQLESCDKGLPLEIYAFTNTTNWYDYENIQSDVFDHLYSIVSTFDLHIYRNTIQTCKSSDSA